MRWLVSAGGSASLASSAVDKDASGWCIQMVGVCGLCGVLYQYERVVYFNVREYYYSIYHQFENIVNLGPKRGG
jgi:hypothetical protein